MLSEKSQDFGIESQLSDNQKRPKSRDSNSKSHPVERITPSSSLERPNMKKGKQQKSRSALAKVDETKLYNIKD